MVTVMAVRLHGFCGYFLLETSARPGVAMDKIGSRYSFFVSAITPTQPKPMLIFIASNKLKNRQSTKSFAFKIISRNITSVSILF